MNKNIYIISLILIWFILNIFFFMLSDNYRYFLQSLKYENESEYKIDDKFKISIPNLENEKEVSNNESIFSWLSSNFWEEIPKIISPEEEVDRTKEPWNKNIKDKEENKWVFINTREKIKITNIEKEILEKLKKHNLKKVDLHSRLFDLTWEYPNEYFEYYWEDINLYFFWNKLYSDLKDIFEVLTYELPFSINEIDNFWDKSFYINLNSWFEDDYIRVVLKKSNRIIWFKIKKQLYEKMKSELWVVFHK